MLTFWHARPVLLTLALLTCPSIADDSNRPSETPTYRSTVSEVLVTFFAIDEKNHPVPTLTTSDFAVVDNERVVRNFRSFMPSDETALEVVVLVDASESVAPRLRVAMRDVLQLVTREQSIPDDNISVLSFGGMTEEKPGVSSAGLSSWAGRPTNWYRSRRSSTSASRRKSWPCAWTTLATSRSSPSRK